MRLVVNIQGGNLTDIEEVGPGEFRARMQPEPNSIYPYPVHQLCWFICRFENVPKGGADAQLTLVNCEWRPDAFRTQRPFLCTEADWQHSENWSHQGLIGMQLDSTRSESATAQIPAHRPALRGPANAQLTPVPPIAPPTVAPTPPASLPPPAAAHPNSPSAGTATPPASKQTKTPPAKSAGGKKPETATLSLFPAEPDAPAPAAPAASANGSPAGASAAPAIPIPAAPAPTAAAPALVPASPAVPSLGPLRADFTGGSMTYRFHLIADTTVALHPPYTHEHCHADLERWGLSPHLHYQRLGASHGGRSFFVVEAARHRAKGVNPNLPFAILLVREHGVESAGNWVLRGLIDRLLADDRLRTLDRLSLIVFPYVNQDAATLGRTVDPHTGLDVGNDFGRNPAQMSAAANTGPGAAPEFKLPESRMIYRYVADQLRAGRRCLAAISLHQPHGAQENIWPVYYLGPARHCQDPALTAFQRHLHDHTRRFTHATPDYWPSRVAVGRFDHDFGIPAVTLEINPHCPRHPLSIADLQALGGDMAAALGSWAETA